MRYVFFGNNTVAVDVLKFLRRSDDELVCLVTHPRDKQKNADELVELAGLPPERVFAGNELRSKKRLEQLAALAPDLGVSVFFGYILRQELFEIFRGGCVNLHPSLLPFNRGAYPNIWSIVDGTPAGVTLHMMDAGVDTGKVIAQKEVAVCPWDTGKTLYQRLEAACVTLFADAWPRFVSGELQPRRQEGPGTEHSVQDVDAIDRIELDREYTARELLDVVRARSFPPHRGAFFEANGRRVYLTLSLEPEEESKHHG